MIHTSIYPKRALGQHFLAHIDTARWIVKKAGIKPYDRVIEIGPGKGILTRFLAETGAQVTAIEKDKNLCEYLNDLFREDKHIVILERDAIHFPWETASIESQPVIVVGNLPYNVSTQILWYLLPHTHIFKKWQFLFQKEVAERICAKVGSPSYGALSVFVQSVTRPTLLKILTPKYFTPPPKVDSALVSFEMIPMEHSSPMRNRLFIKIVKLSFSHRRKMLRNNLKHLFEWDVKILERILEESNLKGSLRAQNLTAEDYLRLTEAFSSRG